MQDELLQEIEANGYVIAPASDLAPLDAIQTAVFEEARRLSGHAGDDAYDFFNRFHEQTAPSLALNDFRVGLIRAFNTRLDVGRSVWDAFEPLLLRLVGPDAAVQRSTNLVIQAPHDLAVSPVHRDAPPSSPYEIVVWVPLVDCYGSKGMVVMNTAQTREALAMRKQPGGDAAMEEFVWKNAAKIEVPYGKALFFWAGLIHAVPENQEQETRWSLNLRYKNLFSPQGTKGVPDYFRMLKLSPLSRIAFDDQRLQAVAESASA